jgi:hypothetical protein
MRSIHIRRAVLLGYVSGALALCAVAGVPLNAAPTAAPGANGPSGIVDDSDGKEKRSPVNGPVRTENAAEMKNEVAIETLEVRSPRAASTNLGDTATSKEGPRSTVGTRSPNGISEANALWQLIESVKQDGATGNQASALVNNEVIPNSAIVSPRDAASGQAAGFKAPDDDEGHGMRRKQPDGTAAAPGSQDAQVKVMLEDILVSSAKSPVAGATPSTGQGFAQDAGMETGTRRKQPDGTAAAPNGTGNFQDGEDIILRKSDTAPTGTISGQGFAEDAGQESGIRRKQPHRHRKASNQRRMHKP